MSADDSSRSPAPAGASATPAPRRKRVALWLGGAVGAVALGVALVIGAADVVAASAPAEARGWSASSRGSR